MSSRAFFFDRDGVVNRDPHPEPYVLRWAQWHWTPGIHELLAEAKRLGFLTILVTSQKGVGKGLMSPADLDGIHERMQTELGNLAFDAIHAFTGLAECPFQAKPDPQMILLAAREWNIDLGASWLIGDADRDIAMARAAGVSHAIRVRGQKPIGIEADLTVDSLEEARRAFLAMADGS